jgi:hypothetical protein
MTTSEGINMTTNTAARRVGWHRPDHRSPWRMASEAATDDEAFNRLLNAVAGGDKVVLRSGDDPNESLRTKRKAGA